MDKIVYLMGAGASRGKRFSDDKGRSVGESNDIIEGLPVVSELSGRLDYIYNLIKDITPISKQYQTNDGSCASEKAKELLLKDLMWLKTETKKHATIDTFAKKLFLKKEIDLFNKVKLLLSLFFVIEQNIGIPDGRYDTFLANVLTSKLEIPNNIKILTWNYDRQFEIAYREYSEDRLLNLANSSKLGVYDFRGNQINSKRWNVYKLNGTADFKEPLQYTVYETQQLNDAVLDNILEVYVDSLYCCGIVVDKSRLYFAWENHDYKIEFFSKVRMDIEQTSTLIVIGYTFPFFNRETDRYIFENMPNLRKIYIQDPNANNLQQNIIPVLSQHQISMNLDKQITTISNCDQFFLPPEL